MFLILMAITVSPLMLWAHQGSEHSVMIRLTDQQLQITQRLSPEVIRSYLPDADHHLWDQNQNPTGGVDVDSRALPLLQLACHENVLRPKEAVHVQAEINGDVALSWHTDHAPHESLRIRADFLDQSPPLSSISVECYDLRGRGLIRDCEPFATTQLAQGRSTATVTLPAVKPVPPSLPTQSPLKRNHPVIHPWIIMCLAAMATLLWWLGCRLRRRHVILALMLSACLTLPNHAQRQMEQLNRGILAMRTSSTQVYVGWRLFGNDPDSVAFNLYRVNGSTTVKLNTSPIISSTNWLDTPANLSSTSYRYYVKPIINGSELAASESATINANAAIQQYITIPLRTDTGIYGPYDVKFGWVGDLDGDGGYDIVIDRLSKDTTSREQFLEAYKFDGTFLWRMSMGVNSINQYSYEPGSSAISVGDTDNVTVYDMDGDGKAEVLVRTANGVTVKNAAGNLVTNIVAVNSATQAPDQTTQFLSVIDGATGVEKARAILPNPFAQHGTLTNKAAILYLDGKRPSVLMYGYNRADSGQFYRVFTTWDYRNGTLSQRWSLAQDTTALPGAEGHQIRIADVDHDGKDEIIEIGHVIDDNGTQLYRMPVTHGDRFHIGDLDPDRPGLETYAIQQNNSSMLATYLDASSNGNMIRKWYATGLVDVGRGIAIDINASHLGTELYSTQPGIFNVKGNQIYTNSVWSPEGLWWDADLGREFIDGAGSGALSPVINKFNATTGVSDRIYTIYSENGGVHQAYGGRPVFWGDILGDWREELILAGNDNSSLRIYSTKITASNRLPTLMHNAQYRCQATTKGYVQASYVDYFLGFGMAPPPPEPMIKHDVLWQGDINGDWQPSGTSNWLRSNSSSSFINGDAVLFDLSAQRSSVRLLGDIFPSAVSFYTPQNMSVDGTAGKWTGAMSLTKVGGGDLSVSGTHDFSGKTTIWDGALRIDGRFTQSAVEAYGGIYGGAAAQGLSGGRLCGSGQIDQRVTLHKGAAITPGNGMNHAATLTLAGGLSLEDGAVIGIDLAADSNPNSTGHDVIIVQNSIISSGTCKVIVRPTQSQLLPGTYTLMRCTGSTNGNAAQWKAQLPAGVPYQLAWNNGLLQLTIQSTRSASSVTWAGNTSTWDLATQNNWLRNGSRDVFIAGDAVLFDDSSSAPTQINVVQDLPVGNITVNSSKNYNISGTNTLSGNGSLTKTGSGSLTIQGNHSFSGAVNIQGGTLEVGEINDTGVPGSLGLGGTIATHWQMNGTTLRPLAVSAYTNRSITIGSSGLTIDIPSASRSLILSGGITGAGSLTKTGSAQLTLGGVNTYSGGTQVSAGTILLASDAANVSGLGSGVVTLNNGTLSMTDNSDVSSAATSAWSLLVPGGATGRLNCDGRCSLSGSLTGSGTFQFYTPYVRTEIKGDWSAFQGVIQVITDADGGDFRIWNSSGMPQAELNLANQVYAYYQNTMSNSVTVPIGALSGVAGSVLQGGTSTTRALTWQIGAKNSNTTFAGTIINQSYQTAITKVGNGRLNLSGNNTYTGPTSVQAGTLEITGSLGNSAVSIASTGTLAGSGSCGGSIDCSGTLAPGGSPGTLSISQNCTLRPTSTLSMDLGSSSDMIQVTGNLTLDGTLAITAAAGFNVGRYPLIQYSGTLNDQSLSIGTMPAGYTGRIDISQPGQIAVIVSLALSPFEQWQLQYFNSTTQTQAQATADPDGDGQSNYDEFIAGTLPNNSQSVLSLTITMLTSDSAKLTWSSVPGRTYQLQASDSMTSSWSTLGNFPAPATPQAEMQYLVPRIGNRRFFRILVQP